MEKTNNHSSNFESEIYPEILRIEKEENHRIVIVSDLHLSGGQNVDNGKYRATENFFYDEEFSSFLEYIDKEKPCRLIINGDFIDFVRLTESPALNEYSDWQNILKSVGIQMNTDDFHVSKRERDLGLKTHEYKSVWKMHFIGKAHSIFFNALARFIDRGNTLVIIKGNHDVEFYWEKVRRMLKQIIYQHLNLNTEDPKAKEISGRIEFCNKACIIEDKIYIEHGQQYDKIACIKDPILKGKGVQELTLSFGLFINRYFLNKVELIAPFIDNVKPVTAFIDAVFKNYPLQSIKTLFRYIPLTWQVLRKHYYLETAKLLRKIAKYALFPLSVILLLLFPKIWPPFLESLQKVPLIGVYLENISIRAIISGIAFIIPFIAPTLLRKDHITPAIKQIMDEHHGLSNIILGHFHIIDQEKYGDCSYYNTGTWIPIIDLYNRLKPSHCFCLILIDKECNGTFGIPHLRQWNNCSGRLEKIVLHETVSSKVRKKKP